ncbi:unnamed protein product [Anisakis simplex]|uniref:BIG2_C domain-containing protein n=1 Tax=Anisakis simplex TaxID=6269 RepID=A0A0M3J8Z1_ANISI|nr:unnamed protein product [Anisakis simplex]
MNLQTVSPQRNAILNGSSSVQNNNNSNNNESSYGINDYSDNADSTIDGLYSRMDVKQLLSLVDCLLDSHSLAKQFNGNNAQRTLLWKAGFKGRSKPNLLRQETHSLRSALCILFRIYTDVDRTDEQQKSDIRERLIRVLDEAIRYYVDLNSEQHRQAWIFVLRLVLDWANSFSDAQDDEILFSCWMLVVDLR